MIAVLKKELNSYFKSMTGYIFMAFFLVIIGIYFIVYNLSYGTSNFEYTLQSSSFAFIILIPILTMRILAEEKKQKTDQLLLTSPLSIEKIILGKYLAVLMVFLGTMAIASFYPLILTGFGEVDLKLAYNGILGFVLMGATYLAIGLFISALTESQMVAAIIGFIVMLITYLISGLSTLLPADHKSAVIIFTLFILIICWIAYHMMHNLTVTISVGLISEVILIFVYFKKSFLLDGAVSKFLNSFSMVNHFDRFTMGILDLSAVVYYVSVTFLFVFLTIQSLKKRRWS